MTTLLPLSRSHPSGRAAHDVRQLFNDTEADQLWLVVGAPPEAVEHARDDAEQLAFMYPDGPKAIPPELEGS